MNNSTSPNFSPALMKIIKLSSYKEKDCFSGFLSGVNSIRSNYKWSEKIYDENNIDNVYLISSKETVFGFIECTYQHMNFISDTPIKIFLHEIHVDQGMSNKGVGRAVLSRLLRKGIPIEMVVANQNQNMLALVDKFNAEHKSIIENTRTVIISPALGDFVLATKF